MEEKYNNKDEVDISNIILPKEVMQYIETIAKNVHDIWLKGRLKDGWCYGKERNDKTKQHPSIIPYEQLSEEEKDYDRNTAIGTLKMLYKLGFKITKK